MIDFHVLGTLDLRRQDGGELGSLLSGPKRLGVLAYLTLAQPHGLHRRDTLLGLLWPEQDQKHARSALRNLLYMMRRSLGPDVLVARGDDLVGVSRSRLWCDAVAFEEELEAHRLERALAHYHGELLEGFFVPGAAPEFGHWLDGERERLRRRALAAAASLAERAASTGDAWRALDWARRALSLSPYSEEALLRLVELMVGLGDRAGAARAYDAFVGRLRTDMDLEPSAGTRSAMATLLAVGGDSGPRALERAGSGSDGQGRRSIGAPQPPAAPPADVGAAAVPANGDDPAGSRVARAGGPRRRRVWAGALAACVAGALVLTAVVRKSHRGPSPADARKPVVVAVLPFSVDGGGRAGLLRDGVTSLLGTALDGIGPLRSVDRASVQRFLARGHGDAPALARGRAVAGHFRADYFLLGRVVADGQTVEVTASIYGRRGRRLAQETVAGPVRSLPALTERLAVRIFVHGLGAPGAGVSPAAISTQSLPALKAYLEGVRAYRRARLSHVVGRFSDAVEAFGQAVAADSTFALARYRLADADGMAFQIGEDRKQLLRALQDSDELTPRYRFMARADVAYLDGDMGRTEQLLRRVVSAYPGDARAWLELGTMLAFQNPLRGRPIGEARAPLQHALALDPGNREALTVMDMLDVRQGRLAEADSIAGALHPVGMPFYDQALFAAVRNDSAARTALLRRESDVSAVNQIAAANKVALYSTDFSFASDLLRPAMDPTEPAGWRFVAERMDAELALARGRYREAGVALASAKALLPAYALPLEVAVATLPFRPSDPAELRRLRTILSGWDSAAVPPPPNRQVQLLSMALSAPARRYMLGLIDARLHHFAAAAQDARILEQWTTAARQRPLVRDLAHAVRAEIALQRGDQHGALNELQRLSLQVPQLERSSMIGIHVRARFLLGEVLRETGAPRQALRWFRTIGATIDQPPDEAVYLAPAQLGLARCYRQLGKLGRAARAYARFLELWGGADPQLQPVVREARSELADLREREEAKVRGSAGTGRVAPGGR